MPEVLLRLSLSERRAAEKELALLRDEVSRGERNGSDGARPVAPQAITRQEIEALIRKCLRDRDQDERLMEECVHAAANKGPEEIDGLNESLASLIAESLNIHDFIRNLIVLAGEEASLVSAEDRARLDKASAVYRSWLEDLPEVLAMAYGPVRDAIQKGIDRAVRDDLPGDDWREYFKD